MSEVAVATARQLRSATPVFAVSDVVQSAKYYRDVLGFTFDRYWGEPPCFVMLNRDSVDLFLSGSAAPDDVKPNHRVVPAADWDTYVWVRDAAALLEELNERGAKIVSGPEATFYHTIEFVVEDPDGYHLCFAQDTSQD